jgi:hypothetical protein
MKKAFILLSLLASLLSLSAKSHSYQLSDGLVVTMDRQPAQTVVTLAGQPLANHRIDCTVAFDGWLTLTNCTLNGSGSFTYVDTSNLPMCFYRVLSAVTFVSVSAEDGRIADKPGNPDAGASVNATDATTSALRAGDVGGSEKQNKAFLSFDTSSIPDGATIVAATVRLRRGAVSGSNPFLTHGTCWMDIKAGSGFSGSTALLASDFEAPADATQAGSLSNAANDGDWSSGSINAPALQFINKSGKTQLRVYFALHDNGDGKADYIGWYSGENATPANRPVLEVLYR